MSLLDVLLCYCAINVCLLTSGLLSVCHLLLSPPLLSAKNMPGIFLIIYYFHFLLSVLCFRPLLWFISFPRFLFPFHPPSRLLTAAPFLSFLSRFPLFCSPPFFLLLRSSSHPLLHLSSDLVFFLLFLESSPCLLLSYLPLIFSFQCLLISFLSSLLTLQHFLVTFPFSSLLLISSPSLVSLPLLAASFPHLFLSPSFFYYFFSSLLSLHLFSPLFSPWLLLSFLSFDFSLSSLLRFSASTSLLSPFLISPSTIFLFFLHPLYTPLIFLHLLLLSAIHSSSLLCVCLGVCGGSIQKVCAADLRRLSAPPDSFSV